MKGFTLLEVLLSIAIISGMAAFSIPVYQSFQVKNDLDLAASKIIQTLIRAQMLSQGVDGDATWGVKIQTGSITIFKGTSFNTRDANFDEVSTISQSIILSPIILNEIIFNKFSGEPQTQGTINLTSTNNEVKTITINSKGFVSY